MKTFSFSLSQLEADTADEKLKGIKDAVSLLPPPHLHTLKYFVEHLSRQVNTEWIGEKTVHHSLSSYKSLL